MVTKYNNNKQINIYNIKITSPKNVNNYKK